MVEVADDLPTLPTKKTTTKYNTLMLRYQICPIQNTQLKTSFKRWYDILHSQNILLDRLDLNSIPDIRRCVPVPVASYYVLVFTFFLSMTRLVLQDDFLISLAIVSSSLTFISRLTNLKIKKIISYVVNHSNDGQILDEARLV